MQKRKVTIITIALALSACTSTTIVEATGDAATGAAGARSDAASAPDAAGAPSDGGLPESASTGGSGGSAGAASDAAPTEAGGDAVAAGSRCDWIAACADVAEPCTVAYGAVCGVVKSGTFACGELRGYAFDDGTFYPCDATGCGAAMGDSARHCYDVSG